MNCFDEVREGLRLSFWPSASKDFSASLGPEGESSRVRNLALYRSNDANLRQPVSDRNPTRVTPQQQLPWSIPTTLSPNRRAAESGACSVGPGSPRSSVEAVEACTALSTASIPLQETSAAGPHAYPQTAIETPLETWHCEAPEKLSKHSFVLMFTLNHQDPSNSHATQIPTAEGLMNKPVVMVKMMNIVINTAACIRSSSG